MISLRERFKKVFLVGREIKMMSPMLALAVLAACGHHDDGSGSALPTQASPPPTVQPTSVPSPKPTPRPRSFNPVLSTPSCTVDLAATLNVSNQPPGASKNFLVNLQITDDGRYQILVQGETCVASYGPEVCTDTERYVDASWKFEDAGMRLYSDKSETLAYLLTGNIGKQALLRVIDVDLLSMGLPEVVMLDILPCKPSPASSEAN